MYVSKAHIERAIEYLADNGHPALLSLLAALRAELAVSASDDAAKQFGAKVENALLAEYFQPKGGPAVTPFYVPFGPDNVSRWRDKRYSGRSLQRQRQDRREVFRQHPAINSLWSFDPGFREGLKGADHQTVGTIPFQIVFAAIWTYRAAETATLAELVQRFIAEFKLAEFQLVGTIFSDAIPQDLTALPLASAPVSDAEFLAMLQAPPAEATEIADGGGGETTLDQTTTWINARKVIQSSERLLGVEEPTERALVALQAGMHVILTGPPGSGKTTLARAICEAAKVDSVLATATDQWTTFDTIGGYFPVLGAQAGQSELAFLPGVILRSIMDEKIVVIDEINRADIDKAFGELFSVLSGAPTTLPFNTRQDGVLRPIHLKPENDTSPTPPNALVVEVPQWWRIIGSMNDSDKASLKRLSFAFMRRFAFIPVSVPGEAAYTKILRREAERVALPAKAEPFMEATLKLFANDSGFRQIGFDFGPAIPLAIIRHAAASAYWEANADNWQRELAACLLLYVFPQLQGQTEQHPEITAVLGNVFDADHIDGLSSRLSDWTGYSAL